MLQSKERRIQFYLNAQRSLIFTLCLNQRNFKNKWILFREKVALIFLSKINEIIKRNSFINSGSNYWNTKQIKI